MSALPRPQTAWRQLAVLAIGTICLTGLSVQAIAAQRTPVHLAATPAATPLWLTRFNTWRQSAGVSALTENTTWSAGDYNHAVYMVKNNLITHYETTGTPYYTSTGDLAAQNSNIYVSSSTSTSDSQAIDWWMQAPFHSMGMLDPRLSSTGFGSYREVKSGWDMGAAVDVLRGNSFSGGAWPVYFPGNGSTEPLTSYGGGEYPDPLQACSGYTAPTGLPVWIELGGNVSTTVTLHSFTGNGTPLTHCVIDSNNSSLGTTLKYRGGAVLIPRQPLTSGVTYVVAMTVNGVPYTWSFSIGNFNACTAASLSATPPSPVSAGTAVVLTATSACPDANPLYRLSVLAPGASSHQLLRDYSTGPTYTWSTTGLSPGDYRFSLWARDSKSLGVYGNSSGRWDAYDNSVVYRVGACSSVNVTAAPSSPSEVGTPVTVTATASGCPTANPLYRFAILAPGAGAYVLARDYSSTPTYAWSPSTALPGTYRFSVWVRDSASTGTYGNSDGRWDAYNNNLTHTLTTCTAVSVTVSPPSPSARGATVTVTAHASGCTNPVYHFSLLAPGASGYVMLRDYGSGTYLWTTTTANAAGVYRFSAWARDTASSGASGNSDGRWDVYNNSTTYTLS